MSPREGQQCLFLSSLSEGGIFPCGSDSSCSGLWLPAYWVYLRGWLNQKYSGACPLQGMWVTCSHNRFWRAELDLEEQVSDHSPLPPCLTSRLPHYGLVLLSRGGMEYVYVGRLLVAENGVISRSARHASEKQLLVFLAPKCTVSWGSSWPNPKSH